MPTTVEQLSPSRVKLIIEIPFSELKPHLNRAYADIAERVVAKSNYLACGPYRVPAARIRARAVLSALGPAPGAGWLVMRPRHGNGGCPLPPSGFGSPLPGAMSIIRNG